MTDVPQGDALTTLDEILALSASMLELAHAQDWVAVANLEVTRNALLKAVFEGTKHPSPEALQAVVRRVLASDRELIELGEQARARVAGDLVQCRQSRKAQSAYAENSNDP